MSDDFDEGIGALTSEELAQINPGIRHTVAVLRSWGFDTTDSGDGATHDHECDLPVPYVHIRVPYGDKLWDRFQSLKSLLYVQCGIEVGMCDEKGSGPTIEGAILGDGSTWLHLFNVVIPESCQPFH